MAKREPPPPKAVGRRRRPSELLTLGARLHMARKAKKLTLQEVGDAVGISPQAVGQWEHNEAKPSFDRLERLAGVLEIELATLVSDKPADMAALADRLESSQAKIGAVVDGQRRLFAIAPEIQNTVLEIGPDGADVQLPAGRYELRRVQGS